MDYEDAMIFSASSLETSSFSLSALQYSVYLKTIGIWVLCIIYTFNSTDDFNSQQIFIFLHLQYLNVIAHILYIFLYFQVSQNFHLDKYISVSTI